MKRIIITIAIGIMACCSIPIQTQADNFDCKKYIAIFARGSGQNLDDSDYQSFKSTLNSKFKDIDFYELGSSYQDNYKYPAVSASNFSTLAGAYFSAGKSYEFGNSVSQGINELQSYINNKSRSCPDTKYVLGGYSQGAMVISSAIKNIDPTKILYIVTFGDPKLYLPEGVGDNPDACNNKNLSDYRQDVPDCKVHDGVLGGRKPYRDDSYKNKLSTWCNIADFMCGSYFDLNNLFAGHTSYSSNNKYHEASEIVYNHIDNIDIHVNSAPPTQDELDKISDLQNTSTTDSEAVVLNDPYPSYHASGYDIAVIYNKATKLSAKSEFIQSLLKYAITGSDITFLPYHKDNFGQNYIEEIASSRYMFSNTIETRIEQKNTIARDITRYETTAKDWVIKHFSWNKNIPRVIIEIQSNNKAVITYLEPIRGGTIYYDSTSPKSYNSKEIDLDGTGYKVIILNNALLGITDKSKIIITDLDYSKENILRVQDISQNKRLERTPTTIVINHAPKALDIISPEAGVYFK